MQGQVSWPVSQPCGEWVVCTFDELKMTLSSAGYHEQPEHKLNEQLLRRPLPHDNNRCVA